VGSFRFSLWFLNDLNKRKLESYQLNAYRDLKLDPPENRVRNEFYPKISHNEENTIIREIIEDAWTVSNWGTFVEKWKKKFEMMYKK
jgi:hypothetical protein